MNFIDKKNSIITLLQDMRCEELLGDLDEKSDYILFRGELGLPGNGRCLTTCILEDKIFNSIIFYLGNIENDFHRDYILELFNDLNRENIIIKYYLEDSSMYASVCYFSENDKFNAKEYIELFILTYNAISEPYKKIMKIIWS